MIQQGENGTTNVYRDYGGDFYLSGMYLRVFVRVCYCASMLVAVCVSACTPTHSEALWNWERPLKGSKEASKNQRTNRPLKIKVHQNG